MGITALISPVHAVAVWVATVVLQAGHAPAAEVGAVAARPAASAPGAGLINDWLRERSPASEPWDIGGQFRVRYEARENAGSFPNRDFLRGLENSNDYDWLATTFAKAPSTAAMERKKQTGFTCRPRSNSNVWCSIPPEP